ncbi:hypothetical protein KVR01_004508 [Diaporthe batatas]|uniref:uncharacterized protein n=1 Tax=Diaporthe batatas TaxID=748121 RepID=UPI001D04DA9A|nr:uncharacterized protein KVR01_004508 [Diaporthe batatas]KAG8165956.1 hypothetical protein KVR01_004508 [Diaporthe batatas]
MTSRILSAALAASSLAHAGITNPPLEKGFGPSQDVAKSRGPQIFNAVNNAMRQWGSSIHHNGMSFYLATVPEGVIFHHGNDNETSPQGPEWLAYEIEHAEGFASGRHGPPGRGPPGKGPPDDGRPPRPDGHRSIEGPLSVKLKIQDGFKTMVVREENNPQKVIIDEISSESPQPIDDTQQQGGWLHTYRTTRPLRYLYVDGMSGGKTSMGTLDTQDYLLRNDKTTLYTMDEPPHVGERAGGPMDERRRASELCDMCYYWNISGIIRMEAGFEVIHCDFQDGLDQIQALQRPHPQDGQYGRAGSVAKFEFIRALSERYNGIGSSRTTIDFSSMVSAFFYPINLTNPDPKRPDLPRLADATEAELASIKADLNLVISERQDGHNHAVNWQAVTDLIVARYADRLKYMVEKAHTASHLLDEIEHLLTVYIDHSGKDSDPIPPAIIRCTEFYLHGISPQTAADNLIHTAIKSVASEICTRLFEARDVLVNRSTTGHGMEQLALNDAMETISLLVEHLSWARFKRCSQCDVDQVCVIPMWPFGTKEDYESPRCANSSSILGDGDNYWGGFGRPGGPRGPPGGGKGGRGPPPP